MALTEKQKRFVDEYLIDMNATQAAIRAGYYEKLSALRRICLHLGLIASCESLSISESVLIKRRENLGSEFIDKCWDVLRDTDTDVISKCAVGILLETIFPGWKNDNKDLAGYIIERDDSLVVDWRKSVLFRDNYTCKSCGSKKNLHVHHVVRWVDEPLLRVDVDNGITLCAKCHIKEHHG